MPKSLIPVCCVAGLLLAQSTAAKPYQHVYFFFARANTNADVFRSDDRKCELDAIKLGWGGDNPPVETSRSTSAFLQCMTNKGYRLDPSGYRTARSWPSRG
jgi:hypothetical protein